MANTISNSLNSLNLSNIFSQDKNNSLATTFSDFQKAAANGDKTALQDAAKSLKEQGLTKSYQADFMQASFTQSGGNFTFQLGILNLSSTQTAFNNGANSFFYQKDTASLTTLTISGSLNALSGLDKILSSFDPSIIGYSGKPLNALNPNEAADLISDSGFFGIENTANRVANFVINGAGNDLDLLKAGRDGVINGYNEAQKMWGGQLPEISQKTQEMLLQLIDKKIAELGGSVVNLQA